MLACNVHDVACQRLGSRSANHGGLMKQSNAIYIITYCVALAGCASDGLNTLDQDKISDEPTGCVDDRDCPIGYICEDGVCLPTGVPNGDDDPTLNDDPNPNDELDPNEDEPICPDSPAFPIGVSGSWITEYHLDWSEYLGPLGNLGAEIDMIDQVLMGNSDLNSIPLVGSILQQAVDDFIPTWVGDLVHILNGIVQFFQDVRIDAEMEIDHEGSDAPISGEENWQFATVMVIDGCPLGMQDPNYPECAAVTVPLNQHVTNFGVIGAEALPFEGVVAGDQFVLPQRRVRFQISQLVTYILNFVTDLASEGEFQTLEQALQSLVDCGALSQEVANSLCSSFGMCGMQSAIEGMCVESRNEVINQVISVLDAIMVEWEIMRFDQQATIFDDDADGSADRLSAPPAGPGLISNGGFEVIFGASMDGTWWGTRPW